MNSPSQPVPTWLEAAFLEEYLIHKDEPVGFFQALFPGNEERVAELFSQRQRWIGVSEQGGGDCDRIGRYLLVRPLGQGGQGSVYLAHDPELGRRVAIKVVHRFGGGSSECGAMRLTQEARLGARLSHPSICPVLDYGTDRGAAYLVMPYVRGRSLHVLLEFARHGVLETGETDEEALRLGRSVGLLPGTGKLSSRSPDRERVVRFIAKVAQALAAVHGSGVVHRDLKPANVMVTPDGEPVILDLGLARDEQGDLPRLTGDAAVLGTPAYLAPEQISSAGAEVGPGVDVWAIGTMLQECLTLRRPFPGPTREILYRQILQERPLRLKHSLRRPSGSLQTIVDVALQKDPERRYSSAREMADDLARWLERRPILGRRPGVITRVGLWARRRPDRALAAAALSCCLLVLLVMSVRLLWEQERSTKLATERFAAVQQIVHDILFDLSKALANVPGAAEARKKLVKRALEYLEILDKAAPESTSLRTQTIVARIRLGDVLGNPQQQNLGQAEPAERQYTLALQECGALLEHADTGRNGLLRHAVTCRERLGGLLAASGRLEDARGHLQEALRTQDQLARSTTLTVADRDARFSVESELADCEYHLGEVANARKRACEVIQLGESLVQDLAGDMELRAQVAQLTSALHERFGDPDAGVALLKSILPTLERAAATHPDRPRLQHSVAVFRWLIGSHEARTGRVQVAKESFQSALEQVDRMRRAAVDESTGRLRVHLLLGKAQMQLASGLFGTASRELEMAIAASQELARRFPDSGRAQSLEWTTALQASLSLTLVGQADAGKRIAERLVRELQRPRSRWSNDELRMRLDAELVMAAALFESGKEDAADSLLETARRFYDALTLARSGCTVCEIASRALGRVREQMARGGRPDWVQLLRVPEMGLRASNAEERDR